MNNEEFKKFEDNCKTSILAKLLYVFYIKREFSVNQEKIIKLSIKIAQQLLSVVKEDSSCVQPSSTQIKNAIIELQEINVIKFKTINNHIYIKLNSEFNGMEKKQMHKNWVPLEIDPTFLTKIKTANIDYNKELNLFKSFWIKKQDISLSQQEWSSKFIYKLQQQLKSTNCYKYSNFNKQNIEQIKSDFAKFYKTAENSDEQTK